MGISYSHAPQRIVRRWRPISERAIRCWGLTELKCALGTVPPLLHDALSRGYFSIKPAISNPRTAPRAYLAFK